MFARQCGIRPDLDRRSIGTYPGKRQCSGNIHVGRKSLCRLACTAVEDFQRFGDVFDGDVVFRRYRGAPCEPPKPASGLPSGPNGFFPTAAAGHGVEADQARRWAPQSDRRFCFASSTRSSWSSSAPALSTTAVFPHPTNGRNDGPDERARGAFDDDVRKVDERLDRQDGRRSFLN